MKSSKTKKIIVFILRILPLVPIFVYLLSVFRTGVYDVDNIGGLINQLASELDGSFSFDALNDFVAWLVSKFYMFDYGIGESCLLIVIYYGVYNIIISLLLLLYNVFSWFINIGNSIIERSFLNEK